MRVLIAHLPRTSALARSIHGDAADWSLTEHLLASAVDALHAANWQRSGKGKPPKPLPRPGVRQGTSIGKSNRSPDETRAFLAQFRPKESDG